MTDITLGKIDTGGALAQRILARLQLWRRRRQWRDELARMSVRDLRDIGLSPAQAGFEAGKPFWHV